MSPRFHNLLLALAVASAPLAMQAQAPVGELYSTAARVRGSVTMASGGGTTVLSGSSIESGEQPASLVLNRGGTLTICQGTMVSVSASADGRDLLFSFGTGTLESRYSMAASADSIITPDLRFVITGPGEFDLDIGVTLTGDTCVRSHKESTGGVIVSEQMGDGSYQVKPSDFVLFPKGRMANVQVNPPATACGCPAPRQRPTISNPPEPTAPAPRASGQPSTVPNSLRTPLAQRIVEPNKHLEVDAPFVFNADLVTPALTDRVMQLRVVSSPALQELHPAVQPPGKRPAKKGFWHRLGKALFG